MADTIYEQRQYWLRLRDDVLRYYGLSLRSAAQALGIPSRSLSRLGKHRPRGATVAPLLHAHALAVGLIGAEGDHGESWIASEGRMLLLNEGMHALDHAVMQRLFPAQPSIFERSPKMSLDLDCLDDNEMQPSFIDYLLEKGLGRGADLLRRFFKRRFYDSDDQVIKTALRRIDSVLSKIAAGVREAESWRRLSPNQHDRQYDKPEVVAALYAAYDGAVETDDPFKQAVLADLVIRRLSASDESLLSIATRLAIEVMRDLNSDHLRAVALIEIMTVQLDERSEGEYRDGLVRYVQPLLEVHVSELMIRHLASLGLLDYEAATQMFELGTPAILNPTVLKYGLMVREPLPRRIMERAHGDARTGTRALREIRLTPAGIITAITAIKELVGLNISANDFN